MKSFTFTPHSIRLMLARPTRKTQTRRLMKYQPNCDPAIITAMIRRGGGWLQIHRDGCPLGDFNQRIKCPYKVGDIVYGKEVWRIGAWDEDLCRIKVNYKADGFCNQEWIHVPEYDMFKRYWVQSTDDAVKAGRKMDSEYQYNWQPGESPCRWRSPRYMPELAARLFIRITDIRAEWLQDISIDDIYAEGCPALSSDMEACELYEWMEENWDDINAARGHAWELNEMVWAYTFEEK